MKLLVSIALSLFSFAVFAGSVGTGTFSSETTAVTHSSIQGESSSQVYGQGGVLLRDGLNFRSERYTRDESSVTEFEGESRTKRLSVTTGGNQGLSGYSSTSSQSKTKGYMDSVSNVDNAVSGTYKELSIGFGSISYEQGGFEDTLNLTETSYEKYTTYTDADSSSAFVAW